MSEQHTSGPLSAHKSAVFNANGDCIAICTTGVNRADEDAANARLYAAAPDLLEALEGLSDAYAALCGMTGKDFCEAESSRYAVARAAIAKATGAA
jgi:hypothetical protein